MKEEKYDVLWGILGFVFPIIGLILFIVWKDEKPKSSKAAGIGALIKVILTVLFWGFIMAFIFYLAVFGEFHPYEEECSVFDENCYREEYEDDYMENNMKIIVNNEVLEVELENNSSSKELINKLKDGNIVINASDYGNFEKVGDLGFNIETNGEYIDAEPGDLILYQGNKICLYYGNNTYMFTKLGHVTNVSDKKLEEILGKGDVTYTLTLGIIDKNEI